MVHRLFLSILAWLKSDVPRAMLQDETVYGPDTDQFRPARWLKDGQLNPDLPSIDPAFGFGRRLCPGQEHVVCTKNSV
jgi:cytochrome P450